jgi:hypothetical protein
MFVKTQSTEIARCQARKSIPCAWPDDLYGRLGTIELIVSKKRSHKIESCQHFKERTRGEAKRADSTRRIAVCEVIVDGQEASNQRAVHWIDDQEHRGAPTDGKVPVREHS